MAVKRQTTNVSYSIADGTSKIEARQWIDSSMAEAEGVGNDDALYAISSHLQSCPVSRLLTGTTGCTNTYACMGV